MQYWLAIIIFVLVYTTILSEKIHRTTIAMLGGGLAIALGLLDQQEAFRHIDFNTIGLLIGMMIIVGIARQSGLFEYLAIKGAKLAGGRPLAILAILGLATAVASALLDNVTTVLLMVPITFAITDRLEIDPHPFLFTEILCSNIGGTATLIGDPPNIMIGSATGLGFMDFLANLAVPAAVILVLTISVLLYGYRSALDSTAEGRSRLMSLEADDYIKDWRLLRQSLLGMGLTMAGFMLHQALHLESATIALLGATFLMLMTGESPEEVFLRIEWPTIFFFAGLFVLVGALVETGVIASMAQIFLQMSSNSPMGSGLTVLWLSALASAMVDNIPFVATMIPLLQTMGEISGFPLESNWWALALGACLGGNGTLIGASANVIVAGIASQYGAPISFRSFLKVGFPLMLMSIMVATIYLFLRFWR